MPDKSQTKTFEFSSIIEKSYESVSKSFFSKLFKNFVPLKNFLNSRFFFKHSIACFFFCLAHFKLAQRCLNASGTIQVKRQQASNNEYSFYSPIVAKANNLYAACERRMTHYSMNIATGQKTWFLLMQWQVAIL